MIVSLKEPSYFAIIQTVDVDLSIIILAYNGKEVTLKTLNSFYRAIAADNNYTYEVTVVDNASSDGVADAVAASFPQVKLIRNSENLGFAKGNNIGFRESQGKYILFSNPDIEINEKTLPTLIKLMDAHPEVGACTPKLVLVRTGEIDWGAHRGFPTPWAAMTYFTGLAKLCRHSRKLSKIFGQYHLKDRDLNQEHEVDAIRGGFFFVRRDIFDKCGHWDEDYFMYGEDLDLSYQIKKQGFKIMYYPHAEAMHYHGLTTGLKKHSEDLSPESLRVRQQTYNYFYDTMKIFYDKNYKDKYPTLVRRLIFSAIDFRKNRGAQKLNV